MEVVGPGCSEFLGYLGLEDTNKKFVGGFSLLSTSLSGSRTPTFPSNLSCFPVPRRAFPANFSKLPPVLIICSFKFSVTPQVSELIKWGEGLLKALSVQYHLWAFWNYNFRAPPHNLHFNKILR